MIARLWRGWATPENAAAYEALLRGKILPGIASRRLSGYKGAHLLRRELAAEVEFVTVLNAIFETLPGDEPEVAASSVTTRTTIAGP